MPVCSLHQLWDSQRNISIKTAVMSLKTPQTELQPVLTISDVSYSMLCKQSFNLNCTHFIHNSVTRQHPLLLLSTPSLSVAVLYCISSLLQEILFSFWQVSLLCLKENPCLWLHLLPFCLQLPQTRQGKMMASIWRSH